MKKENKEDNQEFEMSEEVLRDRRELIKRMREESNIFMNNITMHLTQEYERKLGFLKDDNNEE
jgi:hypothetical protein